MRFLTISGSLRAQSSNSALLHAAAILAPPGISIQPCGTLAELPYFSPDLDREGDVPPTPVHGLRAAVGDADALVISSPEYAHGVPGVLKNALDWLVSGPEMVGKPVALFNATPPAAYAHASLVETLTVMSALVVHEASIAVPLRGRGMDGRAIAADPELASTIARALATLAKFAGAGSPAVG